MFTLLWIQLVFIVYNYDLTSKRAECLWLMSWFDEENGILLKESVGWECGLCERMRGNVRRSERGRDAERFWKRERGNYGEIRI